jgi:YggT family protein
MNIIGLLIFLVQTVAWVFSLLLIVDILLSYFLSPYNSVRMVLDRIVQPVLTPIRRIVPPIAMIDFSPVILLILIQLVESLLLGILSRLG